MATPTCRKLEFLLARLENGDVDLPLAQAQLEGADVVGKAREHQQSRVIPRAEHELDEHAGPPEEAGDLQEVFGPGKSHRFEENVPAAKMHLFLQGEERERSHLMGYHHMVSMDQRKWRSGTGDIAAGVTYL